MTETQELFNAREMLDADDAWQELCEKDDRTSPDEYPNHALITRDELAAYVRAPTCPPGHIMIGDRAVPEPMREAPEVGAHVYLVGPGDRDLCSIIRWDGSRFFAELLDRGLIHSTEANARAHAKAIIAMSRGDV